RGRSSRWAAAVRRLMYNDLYGMGFGSREFPGGYRHSGTSDAAEAGESVGFDDSREPGGPVCLPERESVLRVASSRRGTRDVGVPEWSASRGGDSGKVGTRAKPVGE